MDFKEFKVKYSDEGNGYIEGYASTWIRRPDAYGDVVKRGAFAKSLKERWGGGKGIPLLWAHQLDNLKAFIGTANAVEDDKGLFFHGDFDATEEAQRVRELYKDGRLKKFSFAYDTLDAGPVTLEDDVKANELRELDIYEISCVCVPANDDAGIVAVKANVPDEPDVKAGRRNRKSDEETIKQIISLAQSLLDEVDDTEDPENGEDKAKANAAAEEPEQSNPRKDDLLSYIKNMEV